MKHLFTLLLNFTLLTAFAQTPGWQWVQHGGGDGYPGSTSSNPGSDIVSTSAVDKEGNLIVGGYCSWYPEFDTISFPTVGGVTNWDFQTFFVAKYNSHGDVLWVNVAGGITDDRALALDVDESGNIYVFGTIVASGTGTAHIIAQNTDTIISNTIYSFIKFDKNGNLLHLKNYNPPISNFWGVKAGMFRRLSSGNFVSLVQVNTTGGLANIDGYMAPDNSNNLVFFDTLGNVIQGKVIDTLSHLSNAVNSMVLDDMDNIYMSYLNYNSTQVTLLGTVINPAPTLSVYLLKTNASLNLVDINTSGANCGALAFLTCDGKYLYASDRNPLGASFDGDTANINLQYTIYKIDTNLNRVWTSKSDLQSIPPNWTYMKSVGTNNYVYSAFQNRGTVTWDTVSVITPANTAHMVMLKFDAANGTCLGSYKTSGTIPLNGNQFTDVETDPQGNVYLFGNFTNSIGVPGDSVYSLGGANSPDYFIIKWSPTVPTVVCSSAITRTNTDSLYTFNANATGTGALSYQWSNNGSAFSTNAAPQLVLDNPGTYTICVTVTDANNCTTTHCDTVTITAATCNTLINAQNTDSAYTFTTTNTGIGPYSYAWSNNGTAFSNSATANVVLSTAGTYNICVTVTGSNNCQSSQCYSVTVTAPSCAAHYTLYADTSVPHNWWALNQASGTGTLTYQWSWGDGSNSIGATPSHTYATAGNYNICLTITDSTGCTDTYCDSSTYIFKAESMVTVNAVTQLPTATATGDIFYQRLNGLVFPNPATTQAQLLVSVSANQTAQFTATDVNGKIVASKTIQLHAGKNLYNFRTAEWASGVYIISIKNETLNWSSRLVKE